MSARNNKYSFRRVFILIIILLAISTTILLIAPFIWNGLKVWPSIFVLLGVFAAFLGSVLGSLLIFYRRKEILKPETKIPITLLDKFVLSKTYDTKYGPLSVKQHQNQVFSIERVNEMRKNLMRLQNRGFITLNENLVISPLKFTGPFITSSDFSEIQLVLNGSKGIWYFNDYFDKISDNTIRSSYERYYKEANDRFTLQSDQIPLSTYGTGMPLIPGQGAIEILLTLRSIHYSGKYGGSVKLVFEMEEEYGYEFALGEYLCDLSALLIEIYVIPLPRYLNADKSKGRSFPIHMVGPQSLRPVLSPVFIEFFPTFRAVYKCYIPPPPSGPVEPRSEPDPRLRLLSDATELEIARKEILIKLNEWGNTALSTNYDYPDLNLSAYLQDRTFEYTASRFVYGWLHSQLNNLLEDDDIVEQIWINEDDLEIKTYKGQWLFSIYCKVENLFLDSEWGGEEVKVTIGAYHDFYESTNTEVPKKSYRCDIPAELPVLGSPELQSTPWYLIGRFPYSEAVAQGINWLWVQTNVWVVELDNGVQAVHIRTPRPSPFFGDIVYHDEWDIPIVEGWHEQREQLGNPDGYPEWSVGDLVARDQAGMVCKLKQGVSGTGYRYVDGPWEHFFWDVNYTFVLKVDLKFG